MTTKYTKHKKEKTDRQSERMLCLTLQRQIDDTKAKDKFIHRFLRFSQIVVNAARS